MARTINRVGVFGCYRVIELGHELFELAAMNGVTFVDAPNVREHALLRLDDGVVRAGRVQ